MGLFSSGSTWEKLVMFIYLINKPCSSQMLDLTKHAELKENNVLMNKLVNMRLNLSNIILYVCMHICIN